MHDVATLPDALVLGFGAQKPKNMTADVAANLSPTGDLQEAASQLFALLHMLDIRAMRENKVLAIMPIPDIGLGEAINDRLRRAAR